MSLRRLERLEPRLVLASDFGDAPDTGSGTGTGNYQTLLANAGPSHVIDGTQTKLFLGARVDAEANAFQSSNSQGDDGGPTDDEDGVIEPSRDLVFTAGTTPKVRLRATNISGASATLYGWIDLNRDGVFDNTAERSSAVVASSKVNAIYTLTFPMIPAFAVPGATYARFRLSSDATAASSVGSAIGGEVEDYAATIRLRSDGTVDTPKSVRLASGVNGAPPLAVGDNFGVALAAIGDLDGDGISDIAVGTRGDDTGGNARGALYIQFLNANGTTKSRVKIANNTNGGPTLADVDIFGAAVAPIGDLNGDGIVDLAVGAPGDDTLGYSGGAVHILLMNSNGTVANRTKIANQTNGGPPLGNVDFFGCSIAPLGDFDGDGVSDLAVGACFDSTADSSTGAVYLMLLNANGTAKSYVKLTSGDNGAPLITARSQFGTGVTALGDLDGDGVTDLAVGAGSDPTTGYGTGAAFVLFMNTNGTVKSSMKLTHELNGTPRLLPQDHFGSSIAGVGDLDGDGVADVAVGANFDRTGAFASGAVHVLFLNTDGTVRNSRKLAHKTNGVSTLAGEDYFGSSIVSLGDLNGDGVTDLAVGAREDSSAGIENSGAVHVLFLNPVYDFGDAPDTTASTGVGDYQTSPSNGGPSHDLFDTRNTLYLGAGVAGDVAALANNTATGDDTNSPIDDEDGLLEPNRRATVTVGSVPVIRMRATNLTGASATLYGWIDLNRDGVFDNSTERVSTVVPNGSTSAIFRMSFPRIPIETLPGITFARFRLSTDARAANSTGAAVGGEVEDHRLMIALRSSSAADSTKTKKLSSGSSGVPTLANNQGFGSAVLPVDDINGDGLADLVVGSREEDSSRGGLRLLFMNTDGTAKGNVRIASQLNGGPVLAIGDRFGSSLASVGDLDGDGVADFVIGATGDDTGGADRGAIYVQFLNTGGTLKRSVKIASGLNGGPALSNGASFGTAIAPIGDLNGDGVVDLVVGAPRDSTGGSSRGAVHILFLNTDGTAKASVLIGNATNGGPSLSNEDHFGTSATSPGDLNGDGISDLVVGADGDDTGGPDRGAIYILNMNSNGSVLSRNKIAHATNGGPTLPNSAIFGTSVSALGDLNGDGVSDLAAASDDGTGAVHVLLMNGNGTAKSVVPLAKNVNGGPALATGDRFGGSLASWGDLNGDGVTDLVVGAPGDDTGGTNRGAAYVLFLKELQDVLNVSVTGDESVLISRNGNNVEVRINNVVDDRYSIPADTLRLLAIQGGPGNNLIDLSGVTLATFPSLSGVSVAGDDGSDTLTGSDLSDVLSGGDQRDHVDGRGGNDTLTGGKGDDNLIGGSGVDGLREVAYTDFVSGEVRAVTLTSTSLSVMQRATLISHDSLSGFEFADITGGLMRDIINASAFNSTAVTTLNGGGSNDTVLGTDGPDLILTLAGADSISGNGGSDTVVSGGGMDTISGGEGADNLNGQNGNDLIYGDAGNDVLVGGADSDSIYGGVGNDFVSGQSESGFLVGGDGNDTVQGNAAADTLQGESGDDRLYGLQGNDVISAGDGADSLLGGFGNDSLDGGAGTDTLQGDLGNDTLDGGADSDRINEVLDTNLSIVGISITPNALGADTTIGIERIQITGGATANFFDARLASVPVFLAGGAGSDTLLGGSKADGLSGGDGDDVLMGGSGVDLLDGGDGQDYLLESADADFSVNGVTVTSAATGSDSPSGIERIVLIGGVGANKLDASLATVPVALLGGPGNDTLYGGSGPDTLSGGNRNDMTVSGGDGSDVLDGGMGTDVLEEDALDTLISGGGDSILADVFALLPSWIDNL